MLGYDCVFGSVCVVLVPCLTCLLVGGVLVYTSGMYARVFVCMECVFDLSLLHLFEN